MSFFTPLTLLTCGAASLALGWLSLDFETQVEEPLQATGVVFHDLDRDGSRDDGEPGIPGVGVSNGRQIAETDSDGRYRIAVEPRDEIFVLKPRNWMPPLDRHRRPQFFYLHRPEGSRASRFPGILPTGPLPDQIDFPLYQQEEPDSFQALFFGDTQPRNQREVDFITHDIIEGLIDFPGAFGVTLGDVVFDNLALFEPLSAALSSIGIPWYNVVGNHDVNRGAPEDSWANETFIRHFGPANYAFQWGPVHFLVLDNVLWFQEGDKPKYNGRFTREVLDFAGNYLRRVKQDELIMVCMHIPLHAVQNRGELLDLLEPFPYTVSISAHTHTMYHRFLGTKDGFDRPEPHHHIVNVTACGSWWGGALDETGVPHATMSDGAPNGYSIFHFDGQDYRLEFRAARRPAEYQMNIEAPEALSVGIDLPAKFFVNVFAGSEKSTVEFRLDQGPWQTMKKVNKPDPWFTAVRQRELRLKPKPGRDLPEPSTCRHLWQGVIPKTISPGLKELQVRSRDMFGQEFSAHRMIRILP
ncbi:MAG: metallophosphoesterase [Planctomycetota bacterium]|nr:MAG: metallophosphoesterase [Planctomycetota bacterium]